MAADARTAPSSVGSTRGNSSFYRAPHTPGSWPHLNVRSTFNDCAHCNMPMLSHAVYETHLRITGHYRTTRFVKRYASLNAAKQQLTKRVANLRVTKQAISSKNERWRTDTVISRAIVQNRTFFEQLALVILICSAHAREIEDVQMRWHCLQHDRFHTTHA